MRRIFGGGKPATPQPTLEEATQRVDARVTVMDEKIQKLDNELIGLREKMAKVRPGTSTHNMLKQKALKVLKQRKLYEGQRDQMMNQSFNMEQVSFTTQSMKDTITTVGAMKTASKEMKKQFKHLDIDEIDNLQDDLADIYDQHNEIQDALGRSYDVGEIDESELDAELAALGDEIELDSTPSYLNDTPALPEVPNDSVAMQQAAAMK
ncbi:hypothetical protein PROFUN_08275 [Planoprotostelium fungivorum]|uniref:Charged multivesicular body protein 5 n=1 Tax=Planoprotostelium fungivorum TaxID=1890364 RepID=A0A2P6NJW7_9EUKA|nr:hypothetical protein PROFUN_08275 [Planoprotostelium fungivorum]